MSSSNPENTDEFPCVRLHSKLNEFRTNGKHCDVTVRVEQRIFKAHRVVLASACGYFDALFSVGLKDTFEDTVVLPYIDATAFDCLLQYAYLGILPKISSSNVFGLLYASEYLDVAKVKNCCENFISFSNNAALIENFFEFFEFSCAMSNRKLEDCAHDHFVKNLNILSKDENFLLLTFDQLKKLLKRRKLLERHSSPFQVFKYSNMYYLLDALMRWMCHRRKDRGKYFNELTRLIDFKEIPSAYFEFLSKEYGMNINEPTEFEDKSVLLKEYLHKCVNSDPEVVDGNRCPFSSFKKFDENNSPSLNLYYFPGVEQTSGRGIFHICSVDELRPYGFSRTLMRSGKSSDLECIKIIAPKEPNNYLYLLHGAFPPVFSRYTNISLEDGYKLTSPPFQSVGSCVDGSYVDVCEMRNVIYLYAPYSKPVDNHPEFSRAELRRDIWSYNCELDKWFPIPPLLGRIQREGQIVADNSLIYYIGLRDNSDKYTMVNVDVYDNRTSGWLSFLKKDYLYDLDEDVACCCLNGRIYASNAQAVAVFDSYAAKWETLSFNVPRKMHTGLDIAGRIKMVSYQNKLCMIHSNFLWDRVSLYTTIFDPYDESWHNSKFFDKAIREQFASILNSSLEDYSGPSDDRLEYAYQKLEYGMFVFKSQY